jgi:hypothetical protein
VVVQEQHDLPNALAFFPCLFDPQPALLSDAIHLFQFAGPLLNHGEDFGSKSLDHPLGEHRTNALHHAAAQVPLDAFPGGGRPGPDNAGLQLQPVFPVPHPGAGRSQPFAGADRRK